MERSSQAAHDRMVRQAAEHLKKRFYLDVRADLPDHPSPAAIGEGVSRQVPDLSARGRYVYIFEVETEDSIADEHTRDEWRAFDAYVRQVDGRFWLVVPKGFREAAEARLGELGIEAWIWEM